MSQFRIKNGLIIDNGGIAVTGSISSTAGITGSFSGSIAGFPTDVAAFSSSLSSRIASNEEKTGSYALTSSFNAYTASNDALNTTQNARLASNESKTGSFATTGSNYFIGTQVITGSVYIANDLIVQGSSSLQNITASAVSIGTNTVILNTDSPAVRFAGISVRDSGSNSSVTSSIWYDSLNNKWIYQNESGSSYSGGMFISGPRNTGSLGSEAGMDSGYITKGLGGDHIGPSIIFESGSTNIGIGTNVPAYKLDVNGTGRFTGALTGSSAAFSGSITANSTSIFSNAVNLSAIFSNGGAAGNYNAIELRGGTSGTSVNWQISKDNATANAFELAASTTNGGTTYASPVFKILNTGAATFSSSISATSATFKVNADRNLTIRYDTNIVLSAQADAGGPENLRIYADTFRIYTATSAAGLAERFSISNTGAAVFSGSIASSGSINVSSTSAGLLANGYQVGKYSYFGYSSGYPGVIIGNTGSQTLFFNVDVSGNPSGAFNGGGQEYVWRNAGSFITPNAANNGYNTIFAWNSAGAATFSSSVSGTSIRSSAVGTFAFNTANNGEFQIYATSADGMIMAGRGSNNDMVITNKNGSDVFRIPTGTTTANFVGNVGIGTTSPSATLDVVGAVRGYSYALTSDAVFRGGLYPYKFIAGSGTDYGVTIFAEGGTGNGNIYFCPGGSATRQATITTGGNLLINKTSDSTSYKFQVSGNSYLIGANNDSSSFALVVQNSATTNLFLVRNDGSVQIATKADSTESSANLVLGNTNYGGYHFLDGTAYYIGQNSNFRSLRIYSGGSTGTGVNLAAGATSWGTYSDERMKDIIEPITNALDKVNTLRTIIGKYKTDESNKRRVFLMAQDVQAVLPEAVYDDMSEDKMLSLQYTDIIPLLTKAIQELKAENDTLKEILQRNNIQ